jgi:endo-1,4-beta-xylanase
VDGDFSAVQFASQASAEFQLIATSFTEYAWMSSTKQRWGAAVTNGWSAANSGTSGTVTWTNVGYNGSVAAGQSTEFGFQGTGSADGITSACAAS